MRNSYSPWYFDWPTYLDHYEFGPIESRVGQAWLVKYGRNFDSFYFIFLLASAFWSIIIYDRYYNLKRQSNNINGLKWSIVRKFLAQTCCSMEYGQPLACQSCSNLWSLKYLVELFKFRRYHFIICSKEYKVTIILERFLF